MSKNNKKEQLGMHPSTANNRLKKNLLFHYTVLNGENYCYHCGEELTEDDFTIEHKIPWLHSDNPKELYFDIKNIGYSHLKCNIEASRPRPYKHPSRKAYEVYGCRCDECKEIQKNRRRKQRSK